jgi:hypothetical protein
MAVCARPNTSWCRVLAAGFARVLQDASPALIERAQGRPGAVRTHGPRATKSTRQNHRYEPDIRPSLRDGFTAYTRSPRGPAFLPPCHDNARCARRQHRDARTTRFRRAHRIVRPRDRSRRNPMRPPHPASTLVTIAKRPSCRGGTARTNKLIWVSEKQKYFLPGGWTRNCKPRPSGKSPLHVHLRETFWKSQRDVATGDRQLQAAVHDVVLLTTVISLPRSGALLWSAGQDQGSLHCVGMRSD